MGQFLLGASEQALVLPSGVLEAFQLRTCDANDVVSRLQESLSLKQASLQRPDLETKRQIRCLCMKAKTADRLDVVKKLREITPAGTTGKLCFSRFTSNVFMFSLSRASALMLSF